jgi:hypothetical protein
MKKICFLLVFAPLLLSAQISVKKPEHVFDQLLGTWQFGTNQEFESWTKVKHTYYATVYSVSGKDTTVSEKCTIFKRKGIYYFQQDIVLTDLLNTATYTLIALDEHLMEFENRNHVFPQKIGYEWMPDQKLAVVQEGLVNGKLEFIDFSYTKVK